MLEMKLVLASTSPRRNELLRLLGIPFEKRPSNADETHPEDVDTLEYVLQMAREKGQIVRHSEANGSFLRTPLWRWMDGWWASPLMTAKPIRYCGPYAPEGTSCIPLCA